MGWLGDGVTWLVSIAHPLIMAVFASYHFCFFILVLLFVWRAGRHVGFIGASGGGGRQDRAWGVAVGRHTTISLSLHCSWPSLLPWREGSGMPRFYMGQTDTWHGTCATAPFSISKARLSISPSFSPLSVTVATRRSIIIKTRDNTWACSLSSHLSQTCSRRDKNLSTWCACLSPPSSKHIFKQQASSSLLPYFHSKTKILAEKNKTQLSSLFSSSFSFCLFSSIL